MEGDSNESNGAVGNVEDGDDLCRLLRSDASPGCGGGALGQGAHLERRKFSALHFNRLL